MGALQRRLSRAGHNFSKEITLKLTGGGISQAAAKAKTAAEANAKKEAEAKAASEKAAAEKAAAEKAAADAKVVLLANIRLRLGA